MPINCLCLCHDYCFTRRVNVYVCFSNDVADQLDKLKVDQCKLYLRKHGLRLTGKKDVLIHRIKEHLEYDLYPPFPPFSSFCCFGRIYPVSNF